MTESIKESEVIKELKKKLLHEGRIAWDVMTDAEKELCFKLAEDYKAFLDASKTEREAAQEIVRRASEKGFEKLSYGGATPQNAYFLHNNKCAALARIGRKPVEDGMRIIVSHIDSPRLDLKQNPLYEEVDLAFLKTHYYGGIKKFHWVARPLALHGVIVRGDGTKIDLRIGDRDGDPVLTIFDLLPHLARKVQYDKKLSDAIPAEKLNAVVAALPIIKNEEVKDRIKLQILKYFNEKYGVVEEDFVSAELELVPAEGAKDVGLDRSLVGSYGQDDRVCAYCSLAAMLDLKEEPAETQLILFLDKEEIGSEGNTSGKGRFLAEVTALLMETTGKPPSEYFVRKALMNSFAISADVNGALDPDYQEVHEKRNAARLGYGVCITKFTGSGGKYGASDAHAEYMGWIRKIFNEAGVVWQAAELGKVDEGGGGTLAKFLSQYGMEIVDCGTPLLSMHSPFEVAHKADIWMTYRAYQTFLKAPR